MARDHALARLLEPGRGVLRLYRWERPTVSFGRNEPAKERYDPSAARERGVEVVRRPTGGRAVLHDLELTYAVALPLESLTGFRQAYLQINRALVTGLSGLGVAVQMAGDDAPALPPEAGPCFRAAAAGEVTVGGRKLVGSAQARVGGAILQHGSILLGGSQDLLRALRVESDSEPPSASPATLAGVLGTPPSWRRVAEQVGRGFREEFDGSWEVGGLTEEELDTARELRRDRYDSDQWTWRR